MNTTQNIERQASTRPEKMEDRGSIAPAVDIFENKDEVLIFADLPGVAKENVAIHLEKSHLTLVGKRSPGELEYKRTFVVPSGIDAEKIDAKLSNGVLRVSLPRSAAAKPRQIAVSAG